MTEADTNARPSNVDTVMHLYRRNRNSWGNAIATNYNDAARRGSVYSAIRRSLDAGEYRVVVKGRTTSTIGPFQLRYENQGSCVFGRSYGWTTDTANQLSGLQKVGARQTVRFSWSIPRLLGDQIEAVLYANDHVYSGLEEAFQNVAGNQIFVQEVRATDGRSFLSITYYVNTILLGGFVNKTDSSVVARIGGGEIRDCFAFRVPTPNDATPSADCARLAVQSANAFFLNTNEPSQFPVSIALESAFSDREILEIQSSTNKRYLISAESYGGAGCVVRGIVGPHSATNLNEDSGARPLAQPDAECDLRAREVIGQHLQVIDAPVHVQTTMLVSAHSDREVVRVLVGGEASGGLAAYQVSLESQGGGACYADGFQRVGDGAELDRN